MKKYDNYNNMKKDDNYNKASSIRRREKPFMNQASYGIDFVQ
jgi:hypothetical protein